nr:hypothetical protein [Tanacetum cinerariifolium]
MNDVSLKAMQNQIDMVKNELRNEMKTSIQTSLSNQTNEIKNMMASLLKMNIASTSGSRTLPGNTIANLKGEIKAITTRSRLVTEGPTIPNPPKFVNPEEDECVEETYTDPDHVEYTIKVPPPKPPIQRNFVLHTRDSLPSHIPYPSRALVLMPKYQKMLKALLSNKEKLQELANTPLNENCSAVILKKLPEKLGDPGKFLIPCGFSELKCKALADLGASINLMPLDVFVPVGKFTFSVDFIVVDYESDPRVPLILGRPFLRTALKIVLRIWFHASKVAIPEVIPEIHDSKGCTFLSEELPDIDSFNDIHPHFDDDPLSGSTTYSANSLLEEFADELALITYPSDYDDNRMCDIESDIREIEFLLFQGEDSDFKDSIDQSVLTHCDDLFVDPTPEMFIDEQPPDYSFPSRSDVYPDDFLEIKSDANFDDDSFDSEGEKIKECELLIDQLDLPCDILSEYDSFNSHDFSRDDVLPSPDNEDKVFNPGILIHEKSVKIITRVTQEKKLVVSFASLLFEDFDPPIYELLVFKEVPNSMRLLPFSSENEVKERTKKDKIRSKQDKNGKRDKAEKSQKQLQ